jgi:hypothetical protein
MGWLWLKTTKVFVKHTTNVSENKRHVSIKMKNSMTLANNVDWKSKHEPSDPEDRL